MKRWINPVAAFFAASLFAVPAWCAGSDKAAHKSAFSADAYIAHIQYLADDSLEGRGPGSEGIDLAAAYIADHFKSFGLRPGGDDGTYFQYFEVPRGKKIDKADAAFEVQGLERKFAVEKDWIPFPFSGEGAAEGPVAFVGYGITAEKYDWDDYKDFDATDKIVLMLRYEPDAGDPAAEFGGKSMSAFAQFRSKVRTASKNGAKAVIIVNPPNRDPRDETLYSFESGGGESFDLPMIHVSFEAADALLKKAGKPALSELQTQIESEHKPHSFDLGLTARVNPAVHENKVRVKNVIGILDGDGSTDEMIVAGAHYDHLGKVMRGSRGSLASGAGPTGPQIHNGADDNASGSSGIVELARVIAAEPKHRRNIVFMTFTCEEMGLLGSQHFVNHPTIELEKVKAMFNLDMIGRLGKRDLEIYGSETAPEFDEIVDRAAEESGVKIKRASNLPGNSDHASFQRKKIPVVFPFTGLHKQYHRPEDDWELIDADGAARVLDFSHSVLVALADMKEGPTWKDRRPRSRDSEENGRDGQQHAADRAASRPAGDKPSDPHAAMPGGDDDTPPPMPTVRLGVMPDYGYKDKDKPGMHIVDVVEGGVAEAAGMKAGDLIVRIGADAVTNVSSYMEVLGKFKPGDSTEIVVDRGGKSVTLKVTFKAPPPRTGDD